MQDLEAEKEDCELKAFARLAQRLKKRFPRMRFLITGDALLCTDRTLGCLRLRRQDTRDRVG